MCVLGGVDYTIQIDESVITNRKYNVGRAVEQKWILGIYDTTIRKFIQNRSAPIINEILKVLKPGSTIWTDQWKGCSKLNMLGNVSPYTHCTVNHSRYGRQLGVLHLVANSKNASVGITYWNQFLLLTEMNFMKDQLYLQQKMKLSSIFFLLVFHDIIKYVYTYVMQYLIDVPCFFTGKDREC